MHRYNGPQREIVAREDDVDAHEYLWAHDGHNVYAHLTESDLEIVILGPRKEYAARMELRPGSRPSSGAHEMVTRILDRSYAPNVFLGIVGGVMGAVGGAAAAAVSDVPALGNTLLLGLAGAACGYLNSQREETKERREQFRRYSVVQGSKAVSLLETERGPNLLRTEETYRTEDR